MTPRKGISIKPVKAGTTLSMAEGLRRVSNSSDFAHAVLTEGEMMGMEIPERRFIIRDFITEESITEVNGHRGGGKTWLCDIIGNEVTWGGSICGWKVEQPVNTMIIDGEMQIKLLQERLKMMNKGRDWRKKPATLFIYPENYAYRIGLRRANILDEKWREQIGELVVGLRIKLLIIDNLSSLAPGIDENDKLAFDPVNRWMVELRFNGCSIIMAHHTGKSGEQRGTSAHEDHADTCLLLSKPRGYTQDMGCKFVLAATKDREFLFKGVSKTLVLIDGEQGRVEFAEADEGSSNAAVRIVQQGGTYKDAQAAGVSPRTYYRLKNKSKQGGM